LPRRFLSLFIKHIRNNLLLYFLCTLLLCVGIITGYMSTRSLTDVQNMELLNYLNGFFQLFSNTEISNSSVLLQSLANNFRICFFIWIMGATFIGIPIILILISLRGFIFGFTLSFLVNRLQRKGIVFAMVSMLPSNIFILPALIIIGVVAINFALYVFRNRSNGISNLVKDFIGYTIVIASIFLLIILGSFIEAYFSVYLIKVFIS